MIEIDNIDIVEKIKGTGRTFTASIKAGDTIFTEIKNLKHTFPFSSNQKISIGETPSSFIEAEIQNCKLPLQGYELEVNLYIDDYTIPIGFFTVVEPGTIDGSGIQKIVAYDRMSNTSNFTYVSKGYTNVTDAFTYACSLCGYEADVSGIKEGSLNGLNDSILDGYDCRTVLGYLAGFVGSNCIVGSDGIFRMVKYHTVDNEIDINSLDTLDFPSNSSSVDYIFCTVDENKTVDYGTGKQGINIVNPLFSAISKNQLNFILRGVQIGVGNNYFASKFKQLNGDPRIEVGDTLLVQHRNILTGEIEKGYVPVMSLVREFDGGLSVSIEAYEPETEFYISQTDQIRLLSQANKNTTKRTEAVAELNEVVSNALGLYQTKVEGAGGDVKTYYHNKPTLENSTYIFTMNAGGFAFTIGENAWNGGNPVWQNGITKEGNAIFRYLFAEKISANLIETGIIKSITGNTEFNLNTGIITHQKETTEYTDYVFIDNGKTTIKRIYKNKDVTEYTYITNNGIECVTYTTSTGGLVRTYMFTPDETHTEEIRLGKPLSILFGGTGANNAIVARENLGLKNGAITEVWYGVSGDSSLGTENFGAADLYIPSLKTIMNWNGAYFGTKSNLRYCYKGMFGDLAVKNFSDIDGRYFRAYGLNEINVDSTGGNWSVDISEYGHGTIPEPWVNIQQTSSGHFFAQIAIKCDNDGNADRKTRAMWVRNKYSSGAWSQWTGVQLL